MSAVLAALVLSLQPFNALTLPPFNPLTLQPSNTLTLRPSNPPTPTRIVLNLPWGNITTYLPSHMSPGDRISGAVFATGAGADYNTQKADYDYLNSLILRIDNITIPVAKAAFTITPTANQLPIDIEGASGKILGQTTITLSPPEEKRQEIRIPRIAQSGMPLGISGPFDGNRDTTYAKINGRDTGILAEGSTETYLTSPFEKAGPVQVHIAKNGQTVNQKVNIVGFTFMLPAKPTTKGAKASIGVEVDGLQDADTSAFPVQVNLFIDNPKVMSFDGPNPGAYTLMINKEDVQNGHVLKAVPTIAKGPGRYSVTGTISDSGR